VTETSRTRARRTKSSSIEAPRETMEMARPPHSPAEEIEAISHEPVATLVATAPHGSEEDSDVAPLPASYPYPSRVRRREYDRLKKDLQIELLKVQSWVKETGQRIIVLFEGRDAAGKGGTIKRFMEHLNPRGARVVALENPPKWSAGNGISNATSPISPPVAKWCSSTAPGTTAPASSG